MGGWPGFYGLMGVDEKATQFHQHFRSCYNSTVAAKRILVVDDDPKILGIVAHFLKEAGYEVHPTNDSTDAVRLAAEVRPDLAILDITMPVLDGYGLAVQIGAHPQLSKIPYMFLTARKEAVDVEQAKDLGAVAYLEKPFKRETLLNVVSELLKQKEN